MSRYIEADNAIERLGAYLMADAQIEYGGMASEDINDWKELASDILKGTPSIDIVRCKECKYYKQSEAFCENGNGLWQAGNECFCSYGEREGE